MFRSLISCSYFLLLLLTTCGFLFICFVDAEATPKAIQELMNVPNLSRRQIADELEVRLILSVSYENLLEKLIIDSY